MLRQALSKSSKAVRSASRLASRQQPLLRPQFQTSPLVAIRPLQPASSRWYSAETDAAAKESDAAAKESDEAKKAGEEPSSQVDAKDTAAPADAEAELKKKLEAKDREAIDWKDKYLRSVADFRNLQERTQREMKAARDFAIQKFAKDLVDSVDNLDRALGTVPEDVLKAEKTEQNQDLLNLHEGLKMTETILMQTLDKHGLSRFDPVGSKFNPNEHEATFMTPQADKEDGSVFFTQQKGFKLNGRVLRAAKVGVVKNK